MYRSVMHEQQRAADTALLMRSDNGERARDGYEQKQPKWAVANAYILKTKLSFVLD